MDRGKTFSHQVPYQLAGNDGMGALTGRHGRSSSGARPLARSSQNRSRRIRYCRPVPVRRGLRRAAQPGTPRTGECICTRQQRHTRWGKACPSSPPPPPRETHAHALQTDGSGGNDDSREDMHGETQTHAEMGWACSLPLPERQQLRPEGCSCTAPRNGTQHQCSTTAHTILCLCVVYIEPYTHTRMHGSPRTREKTLQPTASLLHASAFSLELESSLFTLPYWMESTGPATASQVNNSQVTVGVSGSYPPPCRCSGPACRCLLGPLARCRCSTSLRTHDLLWWPARPAGQPSSTSSSPLIRARVRRVHASCLPASTMVLTCRPPSSPAARRRRRQQHAPAA